MIVLTCWFNSLVRSLRSRFMEAIIGEFENDELAEIIRKRTEDSAGGFAVSGAAQQKLSVQDALNVSPSLR